MADVSATIIHTLRSLPQEDIAVGQNLVLSRAPLLSLVVAGYFKALIKHSTKPVANPIFLIRCHMSALTKAEYTP